MQVPKSQQDNKKSVLNITNNHYSVLCIKYYPITNNIIFWKRVTNSLK